MIDYVMEPHIRDRVLESVRNEQAMRNAKAPQVTQEELKQAMALKEGGNLEMNSPIPEAMMNQVQQKKDKDYQATVKEYMKKQEALAKNSEDRSRIMGERFQGQTDLSPLMALSDSWYGGNLAKSYRAPETQAQNMAAQQKYDNQAFNQYGKLADDEMNLLRQNLMGEQYAHKQNMDQANFDLRKDELNAKRSSYGQKPLAAEAIKRLDYIVDGSDALGRLRGAVAEGQSMRPDIPLVGDNDFTAALRDAAEQYGRMQSGGAISRPEEDRFIKAVWKMGDTPSEVLKKIDKQMNMFENRKTRLLSGGRELRSSKKKTATSTYNPEDSGFKEWKKNKGL